MSYQHTNHRKSVRAGVLRTYQQYLLLSPTECADLMGLDILCVRPEITHLTTAGHLIKTSQTKRTHLGKPCKVWTITQTGSSLDATSLEAE